MNIHREAKIAAALAVVVLVTATAFLPSLRNDFVNWDDSVYVLRNPLIKNYSFGNLKRMFTSIYFGNYHPLTLLSYSWDYGSSGTRPFQYHATNLLWHLCSSLLVFWLALLISGRVPVAFVTAVLFGLHPLHVESVAWISERKDLLYASFFFASLIAYCHYLRSGLQGRFYACCLILFLFSLLSKAMAVTLPLVLPLFDYLFFRRDAKRCLVEKIPFFALALIFGGIGFFAQHSLGALRQEPFLRLGDKLLVASFAVTFYVFKLLWPVRLSCLYPYFPVSGPNMAFLVPSALFVLVAGRVLYLLRRFSRKILFSVFFFLLTPLSVLQFVPMGPAVVADRYVYIPSFAFFYMAAEGFFWLMSRKTVSRQRAKEAVLVAFLSVLLAALGTLTWKRCGVWKDGQTLWSDVLSSTPDSSTALNNLGVVLADKGEKKKAVALFERAIQVEPRYGKSYNNLGEMYLQERRNEEAVELFQRAIAIDARFAEAYGNLCRFYINAGKYDEAFAACRRAIELSPDLAVAHNVIGVLYFRVGRMDEAARSFEKAIAIDPDYVTPYNNIATLYFQMGQRQEAVALLEKVMDIDPRSAETHNNLGAMKAVLGQRREAIELFKKAIEIDPTYADAYGNLSVAYFQEGEAETAAAYRDKARELGFSGDSLSLGPRREP